MSLTSGIFPDIRKRSFIKPILKNCGERDDIENYRSITLISLIPKLLEAIVTDFLKFTLNNVVDLSQHDFCEGRSIMSNLIVYHDYIVEDGKRVVDFVYPDFSKAFDRVDHNLLWNKLLGIGINETLLRWLRTYLMGREQTVKLNGGNLSGIINVTSGEPQGAHLRFDE